MNKAAQELGRLGGKAGKGASKRRSRAHYRRISKMAAALRMDKFNQKLRRDYKRVAEYIDQRIRLKRKRGAPLGRLKLKRLPRIVRFAKPLKIEKK